MRAISRISGLGESLWLFTVLRVGLTVFAVLVATTTNIPQPCHFEEARNNWQTMPLQEKTAPAFQLVGVWERWDACWYAKIATFGYEPDTGSGAFFPLFPALVWFLGPVTGDHVAAAGLAVASAGYIAAMVGLYRLLSLDFRPYLVRRTLIYISVFPGALFFFVPFTESVYLATAVWALLAARRGAWFPAMAIGFACGLARPVGALLALPIGWEAIRAVRREGPSWRSASPLLASLAPVLAFIAFDRYAALSTGRSAVDAQLTWAGPGPYQPPWTLIAAALQWIGNHADGQEALNLALLLVCDAAFVVAVRRLPASYTLYALPHLALVNTRVLPIPLTSTIRLLVVIFPLFVAAALLMRGRRASLSWLIVSLLLLGFVTFRFVVGDFVG